MNIHDALCGIKDCINEPDKVYIYLSHAQAAAQQLQAERDAAVEENEFRKKRELVPLYTSGGHGYMDDDDEDFWCPICFARVGTHRGHKKECPRCGQHITEDTDPCWQYANLKDTTFDNLPEAWRGPQNQKASEQQCKTCRNYCGGSDTTAALCAYWDGNVLAGDKCQHYDKINQKAGAGDE